MKKESNKYYEENLLEVLTKKEEGFEGEAVLSSIKELAKLLDNRLEEGDNKTKALCCLLNCKSYTMRSIIKD